VTRISVVRAAPDEDPAAFVSRVCVEDAAVWVTEPDERAPLAVVRGSSAAIDGALATYDVDELVQWDEPIEGAEYSMFAFFRPPEDVERDEFVKRYREHAQLARVHHPGIRRYVQDLVVSQSGEARWACAAISELHFAGRDEYRDRFWLSDESRDVIARDTARFSARATAKSVVAQRVR
jgi:hypothetical protein